MLCVVPPNRAIISKRSGAIDDVALQLAIMKYQGCESHFFPFIDTLPDDVGYIPLNWSYDKLKDLVGTQLLKDIIQMRNSWRIEACRAVNDLKKTMGGDCMITVDDWMWSRSTVQCRAISFKVKAPAVGVDSLSSTDLKTGDEFFSRSREEWIETVALLPFITIANHDDTLGSATGMGNGITHPESSYTFRSETKHYPGQQVYNSYGKISFQQKLLSFGWLDRSRSFGSFSVTVIDMDGSYDRHDGNGNYYMTDKIIKQLDDSFSFNPNGTDQTDSMGSDCSENFHNHQVELKIDLLLVPIVLDKLRSNQPMKENPKLRSKKEERIITESIDGVKKELREAIKEFELYDGGSQSIRSQPSSSLSKPQRTSSHERLQILLQNRLDVLLSGYGISDGIVKLKNQNVYVINGRFVPLRDVVDDGSASIDVAESDTEYIRRVEIESVLVLLYYLQQI